MAKIIAPNKQYTGLSAGVSFVNGIGETNDPHLIKWFDSKGYTVDDTAEREAAEKAKAKKDAEKAEAKAEKK